MLAMSKVSRTLKLHSLKMTTFLQYIIEEQKPSYYAEIKDGEYMFFESDLEDFLKFSDLR